MRRRSRASARSAPARPVVAFCRIDDIEIRVREPIAEPDALIVQDPTLLHQVDVFDGPRPDGYILINSARGFDELGLGEFGDSFRRERLQTVPATDSHASTSAGRSRTRSCSAGFAALTGLISLDALARRHPRALPGRARRGQRGRRRRRSSYVRARDRGAGRMLKQIEGSQAVADAVALLPPRGDLRLSDLAPDPHRRGALRHRAARASSRPCEYVNVESEFAAMSVAIGASAAGARAYTATASQGLLYMAEALYNASGLGLPIVMTWPTARSARRSTSGTTTATRCPSATRAGSSSTRRATRRRVDLHVQAFRLAEELSLPVMVCMDGFILTHAFERWTCRRRSRSTPSCRRSSRARCSIPPTR